MRFIFYTFLVAICNDAVESYLAGSSLMGSHGWLKNTRAVRDSTTTSFVQPPANVEVDDVFREEYNAWAKLHGKSTADPRRFEIFKLNFMLQMQHNKKTGTFKNLNEFGDMTEKEFERGEYEAEMPKVESKPSDNTVEVEVVLENPVPRVRTLDSGTIPRVSNFESSYGPPRPPHVHDNFRDYRYQQQRKKRQQAPMDFETPKVLATQYPAMAEPATKKRRVVRPMQVGPDRIL
mmetsp:Transcript_749/g.1579  ORF Transcript_749/g.1579 Transcript_749/m.1579 type:complete len:234 (-) Transcript_749:402-1103(-)|eukprot:CAMPEP_0172395632 /NCGR_PEP_ID=MMETSP1061-20121228/20705_1 /TAXON_ID=37318 /ORGANISM="Pseudo-nitzschia pungens, Strain cf. pungens" /LENGTH=233 /DNA_ID=CAMNT_0013127279 /DNA_START=16 /DNA_END=717 /DNA_ORIENTATION=+